MCVLQTKFAYFMKVGISVVFADTPWGTVSKAVVCLIEVLLPTASNASEAFDATCWVLYFCIEILFCCSMEVLKCFL